MVELSGTQENSSTRFLKKKERDGFMFRPKVDVEEIQTENGTITVTREWDHSDSYKEHNKSQLIFAAWVITTFLVVPCLLLICWILCRRCKKIFQRVKEKFRGSKDTGKLLKNEVRSDTTNEF